MNNKAKGDEFTDYLKGEDMDKYIKILKTRIASEIKKDEEVLNNMRSDLGKLVLNHSYGKEYIPELKINIENKEQELKESIKFYEGIPRHITVRDILTGICNEGNTFNNQDPRRYVEEHLSGFENMETDEGLRLKGQCTINIKSDKIKKYENIRIPVDGYSIYRLIGHTGEYELYFLSHIREVERAILSTSGISNILISEVIVLYNGKPKRYHIINKKGTQLIKGQVEKMNEKTVGKLQVVWDTTG